ncbi:hypothetical protein GE061_002568 [Apolygus lucorum]|uniref:Gustatory receptor n=2 Tax=Apolygus lucorum TaxID=248454 RepID=A0A8S9X796_APOLU|nr:hypothetical protein GE061_002568 [Apolygus lucorum]
MKVIEKEESSYEPPRFSLKPNIKKAWTSEIGEERNAWRDQFKWVLWGLRIFLRLPYSTNSKGQLEIKYISFAFVHWITFFAVYFTLTVRTAWAIICKILTEKMDTVQITILGYNLALALYSFTYPGSLVREYKTLAKSINKWPEFEELCQKCLNTPIKLKTSLACKVGGMLVVPVSALVIYLVQDLIVVVHWVSWILKDVMMLSSVIFMLLYWVLSAFELINIGELIKLRISEELCSLEVKNVEASKIRDLRMAWLGLVEMIKLNTKSWSYIFTYMVLTLLFVIIMTSFGFISILVKENRFDFDLLFVSLSVAALSYIMFECGHRLTHKAGYEICEVLGNVNILNMDKAAKEEVKFFTKAAKMNYPLVTLGGVFIANRAAMTSMVSSIVTNLIVILQLPKDSSSFVHLSNASNNTNIA